MSKKVIFLLIQTILIATTLGCANINMSEKSTIDLDKNQLVNEATTIISGEVISSEVNEDFIGFPVTDYKIKVDRAFKGNPKSEIVVRTSGGKSDDDMIKFKHDEKVVLFLTDDIDARPDKDDFDYFVVGDYQGKFKEENGVLRNEKFTFDVSTFEEELNQIEEENKASGLKKIKALADEQYRGNSVIFETYKTKNPELTNEKNVQNYIVEINNKIKLAMNGDSNGSMVQLMQSIDELLIENGFISLEAEEELSNENPEAISVSRPLVYFNEKTSVYLILSTFQWNVDSSGEPIWLNESNIVAVGDHNIPGEIQDIFRIKISTDAENTAEIVNDTSFLVTFSKDNENFIYDTPREITPSLVEYQGNDYYFYSNLDGEELLDYSWDHGIMFFYVKSKEDVKYKVESEYLHFYYREI